MPKHIEFENIKEMRRLAGIEDPELGDAIDKLKVGDVVNLSVTTLNSATHMISARITRNLGVEFRARLVGAPTKQTCKQLEAEVLRFTACHIHSIAGRRPTPAR